MPDTPIRYEVNDRIGRITFNRPDNRNSMNRETLPVFQELIRKVRADTALRCLVITGSGNTFCGGGDFRDIPDIPEGRALHEMLMDMYRPFLEVGHLEIPVIAAMNGHAIGGGLGLSLMCDIRVANRTARYGVNFARLGIHSGMALSYLLPRLVGLPVANELLFTGRIISGEKAAAIGLVNYAVEEGEVLNQSLELAREIADGAPAVIRMMKRSVYRNLDWDPFKAAMMESVCQALTFGTADAKEGIGALLEKRKPDFQGR